MSRPLTAIHALSWLCEFLLPPAVITVGLCLGLALEGNENSFSTDRISFCLIVAALPLATVACLHFLAIALCVNPSFRQGVRTAAYLVDFSIAFVVVNTTNF
ncbi:hypothetical protein [Alienimonas chondri]|uniref:Uncharacterized protein n=1 Tax=Alienimonas chondri TaxID=2681879 RepID=A0ABX1VIX8_9PLAN|nr:hypothetical protein [Alienimonas chondri]NNJ27182.1 hypothetical protein [Alienimonas chondri]